MGQGVHAGTGLGYLIYEFFCPADSLFLEDDQASGQTGKKSWQEAGKNPNQTDFSKSLRISCDLARTDKGSDNTCEGFVMPSLSARANL